MKGQRVQKDLHTPKGDLMVEGPIPPEEMRRLVLDEGLTSFRPPKRQHGALMTVAEMPLGRVVAAHDGRTIVGYVAFHPPDEIERWSQASISEILEMGALEVSPAWRGCGVASALLEVSFADDFFEDYIVISTEFYWHWDLKGTGLSIWEYQDVLKRLLGRAGMREMSTDEPDVVCHPANMLMVRVGSRVHPEALLEFERLRHRGRGRTV